MSLKSLVDFLDMVLTTLAKLPSPFKALVAFSACLAISVPNLAFLTDLFKEFTRSCTDAI